MRLGRGTRILGTPAVGRYPDLVEMALARLGIDPQRCSTHRCRIDYPVMLSRAVLSFALPDRPA